MLKEFDTVILRLDAPEHGLKSGAIGAVVYVHNGGKAYEVEFVTLSGDTIAVETLLGEALSRASADEIVHARKVTGAA